LLFFRSFSRGVSASAKWGWPLLRSCCKSTTSALIIVSSTQNPQKCIQLNCIIETWWGMVAFINWRNIMVKYPSDVCIWNGQIWWLVSVMY
jgi:hypothetical protein